MHAPATRTLTGRTLLRLALGGTLVLLLAGAATTWILFLQVERHANERLGLLALERARILDQELGRMVTAHEVARRAFVERWPEYQGPDILQRFDALFVEYPDGAVRNRPEISDGSKISTGWIRRGERITDDLRRRMVLFFDLAQHYGPGMVLREENLYFTAYPEQANMGYDPVLSPNWILEIDPDFDQTEFEWGRIAYSPAAPGGPTVWSGPELDESGGQHGPNLGAVTPIHWEGQLIGQVGSGFGLTGLLRRVLAPGGGTNRYLILRQDGLIVHDTHEPTETLRRAHRPLQQAVLAAADRAVALPATGYDGTADMHFAVARADRPGWLVASVLPGRAVRAEALGHAQWPLWTGFATLLALLAVLAIVLRREVARPLGALTRAAEQVAAGETDVRIPAERGDELGRLAHAFNDMTAKVAERDAVLRRDKTRIEAALAEVRRTEERWRAMTENASDLIVVMDAEGAIRYASPSVSRFLGRTADDLLGSPALDWVHPDDRERLAPFIADPAGEPLRFRARDAHDEWRELESLASDLRAHPAVGGQVITIRDVTDQARAEAELARQREALHQSEKLSALGGLLAGVAHELNNPLAIVLGRAIQLEGAVPDDRQRETATKIREAAERCSRIVKSFLAMARQNAPRREPTDVNAVIRSALEMLDYGLRSGGIEVETRLDPRLPLVQADPAQLGQIFLNLLTNAMHALAEVTDVRRIEVLSRSAPGEDHLVVEVADTGPGIPTEIRSRIFEPFFTTKGLGEGTGVGLSISLGIAQAHGGRLDLLGAHTRGARFRLTLPIGAGADPGGAECNVPGSRGRDGLRILIVDDEVEIVEILRDILTPRGHVVTGAYSGREALARLSEHAFDLVLTDLRMPDMDGQAIHREIATRYPRLLNRFVAVTGDTLGGTARRFLEESGVPVVHKPFTPEDVLAVVSRFTSTPDEVDRPVPPRPGDREDGTPAGRHP